MSTPMTFEALCDRTDLFERSALMPRPARIRPNARHTDRREHEGRREHGQGQDDAGCPVLDITQTRVDLAVHPQLPPTPLWAYEGSVPGPTLEVHAGDRVTVTHRNRIDGVMPVPHVVVDTSLGGSMNLAGSAFASTAPEDLDEAAMVSQLAPYTVVHLHGAPTPPDSDGQPEHVIGAGEDRLAEYQFPREAWTVETTAGSHTVAGGAAPMYWYHDHAMAATRFNVYAGLAGTVLVRDPVERHLGLPTDVQHEIPLVLMDRGLETADGSAGGMLTGRLLHKVETSVRECFAPVNLVNGQAWPRCRVTPRVHRLRLVNGSNARTYRLHFLGQPDPAQAPVPVDQATVQQIGTDDGLLGSAVPLPGLGGGLLMSPGERADVLVDFGLLAQSGIRHVVVANSAPAPYGGSELGDIADILTPDPDGYRTVPEVMRFDIAAGAPHPGLLGHPIAGMTLDTDFVRVQDHHDISGHHGHTVVALREEDQVVYDHDREPVLRNGAVVTRTMLYLHELLPEDEANRLGVNLSQVTTLGVDATGAPAPTPVGVCLTLPGDLRRWVTVAKRFHDTTSCHVELGSWHVFKVINLSPDTHPFHVHLTQFQAMSRVRLGRVDGLVQPKSGATLAFDQTADVGLDGNEQGWKDTFRVNPGDRDGDDNIITAEMVTLTGCFSGHAGRYLYHCHILEHEDNDMMRSLVVIPKELMALMM